MNHIKPSQRESSLQVPKWVTSVCRPLSLRELAWAVGHRLQAGSHFGEEEVRLSIAACGPLLHVRQNRVGLVHNSAKDFLLQQHDCQTRPSNAIHISVEKMNMQIASVCIDALAARQSPLSQYAAEYWPYHARQSKALAKRLIRHDSLFFETKSVLRDEWWEASRTLSRRDFGYIPMHLFLVFVASKSPLLKSWEVIKLLMTPKTVQATSLTHGLLFRNRTVGPRYLGQEQSLVSNL